MQSFIIQIFFRREELNFALYIKYAGCRISAARVFLFTAIIASYSTYRPLFLHRLFDFDVVGEFFFRLFFGDFDRQDAVVVFSFDGFFCNVADVITS